MNSSCHRSLLNQNSIFAGEMPVVYIDSTLLLNTEVDKTGRSLKTEGVAILFFDGEDWPDEVQ
jgi:hypothetical protein